MKKKVLQLDKMRNKLSIFLLYVFPSNRQSYYAHDMKQAFTFTETRFIASTAPETALQ